SHLQFEEPAAGDGNQQINGLIYLSTLLLQIQLSFCGISTQRALSFARRTPRFFCGLKIGWFSEDLGDCIFSLGSPRRPLRALREIFLMQRALSFTRRSQRVFCIFENRLVFRRFGRLYFFLCVLREDLCVLSERFFSTQSALSFTRRAQRFLWFENRLVFRRFGRMYFFFGFSAKTSAGFARDFFNALGFLVEKTLFFGSENFDHFRICFKIWAFYQVNAVGDGRKYGIEALADCGGFSR
ncbi:hypothetical protein SAMN05444412_1425, partial [Rhodonellum ikkaensis]